MQTLINSRELSPPLLVCVASTYCWADGRALAVEEGESGISPSSAPGGQENGWVGKRLDPAELPDKPVPVLLAWGGDGTAMSSS